MTWTTTRNVEGPSGALAGSTNFVDPGVPGATDRPVEPDMKLGSCARRRHGDVTACAPTGMNIVDATSDTTPTSRARIMSPVWVETFGSL
jgi:hypothetical protein